MLIHFKTPCCFGNHVSSDPAGGLRLISLATMSARSVGHLANSNCSHLVLQRRACKDLHLFDLRGCREQFVCTRPQRLRNLATQVSIAAPFICKGVEDAEFPWPKLDRIPFQGLVFIKREGP